MVSEKEEAVKEEKEVIEESAVEKENKETVEETNVPEKEQAKEKTETVIFVVLALTLIVVSGFIVSL